MELENRFVVGVPLASAWAGLLDIPLVVDCLPGATLTETVDPMTYKGTMRVRLGPITMEFSGTLRLESVDDAAHRAVIRATWRETRNRGSATSHSVLEAAARDAGTEVMVKTRVALAGQIAQYGRGVGVIQAVSAELVKVFAADLQAALEKRQLQPKSAAAGSDTSRVPPEKRAEISPLALVWAAFVTWLRGLRASR